MVVSFVEKQNSVSEVKRRPINSSVIFFYWKLGISWRNDGKEKNSDEDEAKGRRKSAGIVSQAASRTFRSFFPIAPSVC